MASQKLNIPGPKSLIGPFGPTFSFFKNPIHFLNKAFQHHGQLIGVNSLPMATPPQPGYPGVRVFIWT